MGERITSPVPWIDMLLEDAHELERRTGKTPKVATPRLEGDDEEHPQLFGMEVVYDDRLPKHTLGLLIAGEVAAVIDMRPDYMKGDADES